MLARIWSVTPTGRWAARIKVTPEHASQAGDAFQLGLVFGIAGDHFGKFIDDDEQVRVGRAIRLEVQALSAVMNDILRVGVGIELLTAIQFGDDGGKDTRRGRLIEVGDDIHFVRQLFEGFKGRTTFVVDQHKVEHIRAEVERHTNDQGHQAVRICRNRSNRQ